MANDTTRPHIERTSWLQEILGKMDVADFCACIGQRPVPLPGPAGRFSALFGWRSLNDLLETHLFTPASLRLVKAGQDVPSATLLKEAVRRRGGSMMNELRLDATAVTQGIREGATLIVNSIQRRVPALAALAHDLASDLHARLNVNMYAALHDQHGFETHYDTHDVLVLQVLGQKRWQLFGRCPMIPLPYEDFDSKGRSSLGNAVWDEVLTDGDALYLPRGWWHIAKPSGPTIHLTCSIVRPTGHDLLQWAVGRLCGTNLPRIDIPADLEGAAEYVGKVRTAIEEVLASPALLREFAESRALQETEHWAPRLGLPWSATPEVLPPRLDSIITLSGPIALQSWDDPSAVDSVRLFRDGRVTLTLRSRVRELCDWLQREAPVTIERFLTAFGGAFSEETLRRFLTELASAGLICVLASSDSEGEASTVGSAATSVEGVRTTGGAMTAQPLGA